MKKKLPIIMIFIILTMCLGIYGCNEVKTSKDYYLYTYQTVLGDFLKNTAKISFSGDEYTFSNNNGMVTNLGIHSEENGKVSFVPDKIGDNSQIAATTYMIVYKEFLIEPAMISSRVGETIYEDRDELEGIYTGGFKLSDGKIYESVDGSDTDESFTEMTGVYEENKDYIVFRLDDGTIQVLLTFIYEDGFGNKVASLVNRFYSYKTPNLKTLEQSFIELDKKVYAKSDSNTYDLGLIVYPERDIVTEGVTFKVIGNSGAAVTGRTLSFNGTGSVTIEYEYNGSKKTESIRVIDFALKSGLTDAQRTYSIGDVEAYSSVLFALTDYYDDFAATYESVTITDTEKAECESGFVTFKAAGTVAATLTVRYVRNYADGREQILELTETVNIIIS